MLASIRHFFRFIDLDRTFDEYGFQVKRGAAFKLNEKHEGYTDFVVAGGPGNYSWNVVRSEADELIFKHAAKLGAKTFDETKVESIEFVPTDIISESDLPVPNPGRPVSAKWSRKDGSAGEIKFDYVVDASGRNGLVSTKYLKNRKVNQGLKNIAHWGYWKGAASYAEGTTRENQPFFEALADASGWCWAIPLHNGTLSIGIVMNQDAAIAAKKAMESPSTDGFYKQSIKLARGIEQLLSKAELTSDVKAASDWSYNASCYASPNVRIVGDAGCFIDPYFSSGVHLAFASALSAATTIRASMRGDTDEKTAMKWHSSKVSEGYTRFLLVVLSSLKQIRESDKPVLSDWDEDGFDKAFSFFRPIIQGNADVAGSKLTQDELNNTVDFCLHAFEYHDAEKTAAVQADLEKKSNADPAGLSEDEMKILRSIRARQMLRFSDSLNNDNFGVDAIDGYAPQVKKGNLTLVRAGTAPIRSTTFDFGSALLPEKQKMQEQQKMVEQHVAVSVN